MKPDGIKWCGTRHQFSHQHVRSGQWDGRKHHSGDLLRPWNGLAALVAAQPLLAVEMLPFCPVKKDPSLSCLMRSECPLLSYFLCRGNTTRKWTAAVGAFHRWCQVIYKSLLCPGAPAIWQVLMVQQTLQSASWLPSSVKLGGQGEGLWVWTVSGENRAQWGGGFPPGVQAALKGHLPT